MPRYICKLTDSAGSDYYMEWSTISDGPFSRLMSLDQFRRHYRRQYGKEGMRELPERMACVEQYGTSCMPPQSVEELIAWNRAGDDESCLTKEQILEMYMGDSDE